MSEVIRHVSHRPLNIINKWPVLGLFIHQHYAYTKFERSWFGLSINSLPFIIGHVFEQTHFMTVIFTLNVRINHNDITRSLVDIRIEMLGDIAVPIEVMEMHGLTDDLLYMISKVASNKKLFETTLHCYVKGWFW